MGQAITPPMGWLYQPGFGRLAFVGLSASGGPIGPAPAIPMAFPRKESNHAKPTDFPAQTAPAESPAPGAGTGDHMG